MVSRDRLRSFERGEHSVEEGHAHVIIEGKRRSNTREMGGWRWERR